MIEAHELGCDPAFATGSGGGDGFNAARRKWLLSTYYTR